MSNLFQGLHDPADTGFIKTHAELLIQIGYVFRHCYGLVVTELFFLVNRVQEVIELVIVGVAWHVERAPPLALSCNGFHTTAHVKRPFFVRRGNELRVLGCSGQVGRLGPRPGGWLDGEANAPKKQAKGVEVSLKLYCRDRETERQRDRETEKQR